MSALHAVVARAAAGELPHWSDPSEARLAHMHRVASLLGTWADRLELPESDRARWRAVGILHDALREVPPDVLRDEVAPEFRDLPGKLLHGPAAAARLRAEGVTDEPLLNAVAFHTIGHPALDDLGRALFVADYIEPGRRYDVDRLAAWRERMPAARDAVVREVLRARIDRLLDDARPIRSETASFWNVLTGPARDGS